MKNLNTNVAFVKSSTLAPDVFNFLDKIVHVRLKIKSINLGIYSGLLIFVLFGMIDAKECFIYSL